MKKCMTAIALSLFLLSSTALGDGWKALKDGLSYKAIDLDPGTVHAFRIDPKKYKLGIVTASELGENASAVRRMAKARKAMIAVNGGFFTPEYKPLGLLVSDGKVLNPLKNTSWWSVFMMKGASPEVVHTGSFTMDQAITMAVQSGPRLVINGSVPRLKPSAASRTALCIDTDGKVIVAATENLFLSLQEFASLMQKGGAAGGLGCFNALNLDGGSSTQMYAKVGSFSLDVPGINNVPNAVVVLAR